LSEGKVLDADEDGEKESEISHTLELE